MKTTGSHKNGIIKLDEPLKGYVGGVEIKTLSPEKNRSWLQHKLYRAVLRTTSGNLEEENWNSVEKIHLILRIWCGFIKDILKVKKKCPHCEKWVEHEYFIPKSTSYGECKQEEFQVYSEKAIQKCADKLGTTTDILKANAE